VKLDAQDYRRARTLFLAARELSADERRRFLAERCGEDSELRREVESLLEAAAGTPESFLEPARSAPTARGSEADAALAAGSRLGPYEIVAFLGRGGMGEVYRGRDTRLGREVAIKVLSRRLARDPQRRRRLEREARAVSALSHPNISACHDVGRDGDTDYLVFELVEGETLAQRIARGPLAIDEALRYGAEIASALAAAHRRSICHRDLKPANVMLTREGSKLLDFGLAKVASDPPVTGGSDEPDASRAPATEPLTVPGTLVGTVAYMAPEQLEGRAADSRGDLFALGAVLYEMLTGERPFAGEGTAAPVAAAAGGLPASIAERRAGVPERLDRIVRKCLAGDPELRWQSAADLADELSWLREELARGNRPPLREVSSRRPRAWAAGLTLGAAALSVAIVSRDRVSWDPSRGNAAAAARPLTVGFHLDARGLDSGGAGSVNLAVAPAGDAVAFAAWRDGSRRLWIRRLADPVAWEVPGSQGAENPFWSPDGRRLGFTVRGSVWVAGRGGEPPRKLFEVEEQGFMGPPSWGPDDTLLFCRPSPGRSGVHRVRIEGDASAPVAVATPEQTPGYRFHAWPQQLPDGRFLFLGGGGPRRAQLFLGSLDGEAPSPIDGVRARALWAEPGYLLYGRGTTLLAQAFDPGEGRLEGEPILVAERLSGFGQTAGTRFGVSRDLLVFSQHEYVAQLTWLDRRGGVLEPLGRPGDLSRPRISPDGGRVAVQIADPRTSLEDLWVFDLARGVGVRLEETLEVEEGRAVWSPDGRRLAYYSDVGGFPQILVRSADGRRGESRLVEDPRPVTPLDWSPDGSALLYGVFPEGDLWLAPLDGGEPRPYLEAPGVADSARFSPDGRWVAFESSELGPTEIFVAPVDDGHARRRVSTAGGRHPVWRRDGRELYYRRDRSLYAVPVTPGAELAFGDAEELFRVELGTPASFDVSADGERFLVSVLDAERVRTEVTVVAGWRESLFEATAPR
jgi:eukaryotic-like serine/threonine-protein kinase